MKENALQLNTTEPLQVLSHKKDCCA